jgi:hypothetical protein
VKKKIQKKLPVVILGSSTLTRKGRRKQSHKYKNLKLGGVLIRFSPTKGITNYEYKLVPPKQTSKYDFYVLGTCGSTFVKTEPKGGGGGPKKKAALEYKITRRNTRPPVKEHMDTKANTGCPNKSARVNFVIKRTIYSKSADIFISV